MAPEGKIFFYIKHSENIRIIFYISNREQINIILYKCIEKKCGMYESPSIFTYHDQEECSPNSLQNLQLHM